MPILQEACVKFPRYHVKWHLRVTKPFYFYGIEVNSAPFQGSHVVSKYRIISLFYFILVAVAKFNYRHQEYNIRGGNRITIALSRNPIKAPKEDSQMRQKMTGLPENVAIYC